MFNKLSKRERWEALRGISCIVRWGIFCQVEGVERRNLPFNWSYEREGHFSTVLQYNFKS